MSKKATIEPVEQSEIASLYTISFENDNLSEFAKFMTNFKDNARLQRDYQIILLALQKILENGTLERYFRPEGKFNDGVCALPISSGKLRLYCLRLSDKILIIGNGGIKDSKTYNENYELNGYVIDLQKFDALIKEAVKAGDMTVLQGLPDYWTLLVGQHGGSLGEVSAIAILIGGIYLLCRRVISWHIPVSFILTTFVFAAILHLANPAAYIAPLYHVLCGGLLLGAVFMATDMVTSPMSKSGQLVFGIGCGLLTVIIRTWGAYPEGVSFAILLMNAVTPLINKGFKPKRFAK